MALRRILVFPTPSCRPFALTRSYVLPTSPNSFSAFASLLSPLVQAAARAQTMRAVLLANATATSIFGLRARILVSQGSDVSPRRLAW